LDDGIGAVFKEKTVFLLIDINAEIANFASFDACDYG
jgi:hypothetical protein